MFILEKNGASNHDAERSPLHRRGAVGLAATLVALATSLSVACGGATPEPAAPTASAPAASSAPASPAPPASAAPAASTASPAPSTSASAAPVSDGSPWTDGMTKEQEIAFMKTRVVPAMGPAFKEHSPKYANFSCKTCHGPEGKEPKAYLPKLTMKDGKLTAFAEKPEMAKFMAESVTPKMATAMGLPPYDMKTHQGFGCGGCHTIDMK